MPSEMSGNTNRAPLNVRAEMNRHRSVIGKVIDATGGWLSQPLLFLILLGLHLAWIVINLGAIPGFEPWDRSPFRLLSLIASVEAPFIALLILMRQLRDARIAELREEILLQVALDLEDKLSRRVGEKSIDPKKLMEGLQKQLDREEGRIEGEQEEQTS